MTRFTRLAACWMFCAAPLLSTAGAALAAELPDGWVTAGAAHEPRFGDAELWIHLSRRAYFLQQRLQEMRIVSVRVTGRIGVLGAEVRLADAGGRVVARRVIGSAVLTGCRGPDTVNLVARPPGRYRLTVRFADGTKHTRDLELDAEPRTVVVPRHPTVEIRDSGSHPASAGASPEEHGPTACPGQCSYPSTTTRRGGDQ